MAYRVRRRVGTDEGAADGAAPRWQFSRAMDWDAALAEAQAVKHAAPDLAIAIVDERDRPVCDDPDALPTGRHLQTLEAVQDVERGAPTEIDHNVFQECVARGWGVYVGATPVLTDRGRHLLAIAEQGRV